MTDDPSDDRDPPALPGDRIGRYELIEEIGHGGMGVVFRAKDLDLDRKVAIKFPWKKYAEDHEYKRRFLREARATARLNHPNIVPVIEAMEQDGKPCLVLQFVDGENLQSRIIRKGKIETHHLVRYAEDLASALEAAHAGDVLHRDINPRNILVSPDGRALLTDFGLARTIPRAEVESSATTRSSTLTSKGSVMGTPRYMSPEQALGKNLDERSDLYSLGTVLYEMASGKPVFSEKGMGELYDAIMHHEPAPLSRFTYEMPDEMERIIRKAMAKRPDERYQRATDLLADLRAFRRQLDFEDYSSSHGEMERAEVKRKSSKIWWLLAVGLAVSMAIWTVLRLDGDAIPRAKPTRVTQEMSWEGEPAISPDGREIVYVSDASGNLDLYIIDIRGGDPLQITTDPATDRDPFWFPDGSAIGFSSSRNGKMGIWKIGRLGGGTTLLLEGAEDAAISPDGTRLAFSLFHVDDGRRNLGIANLADQSGIVWLGREEDDIWDHRNPAWSPDGKSICFDNGAIRIVSLESQESRSLTDRTRQDTKPAWSADGRYIYFSSNREGTNAIWRVEREGGLLERVTMGTGPERRPDISRDGKLLVYATGSSHRDNVLLDRETGRQKTINELREDRLISLAPDQSRLVFSSKRQGGKLDLWELALSGNESVGKPRRLIDQPGYASYPAFSPDGKWIAYHRILDKQRDIVIIPSDGGAGIPFTVDPAADIIPVWSPDGSEIAFSSNQEGQFRIYAASVIDGKRASEFRAISPAGISAYAPAWSPDGKWIAFPVSSGESQGEVFIVPARGGEARQVTREAEAKRIRWDVITGALLVSGAWGEDHATLRIVPVDGGEPTPFTPAVVFGEWDATGIFDLSPDGRFLIYSRENLGGDIWALQAESGTY